METPVRPKDLNIIVGRNDIGKSNLLKALNLFFNNETEIGVPFRFIDDYSHHAVVAQKKAKEIRIELTFKAPDRFIDVFPDAKDFSWQNGYGAFSIGPTEVERIKRYIANQKIHHGGQSFEDEFVDLLTSHEVEFDRRYLWT